MSNLTVLDQSEADVPVSPDAVDPALEMRADRILSHLKAHGETIPNMCSFARQMFDLCPGIDKILKPKLVAAGGVYAEVSAELDRESKAA